MKRLHLLPQGLIGRATLVLMCAVLIEFLGSSILYERVEIHASRTEQAHRMAEQLVTAVRVLDTAPMENRSALASTLGAGKVQVVWKGLPSLPPDPQNRFSARLRNSMAGWEPALASSGLRVGLAKSSGVLGKTRIVAAARLSDGTWVAVASDLRTSFWAVVVGGLTSAAILCAGVLGTAALLLRSMGAPLRTLAHAAEAIGEGRQVDVPEEGAGDLRHVARAFNTMQRRISELLATRMQALAAVSHDLRTPLARLRLRAGMVKDVGTRAALEQDLDEMSEMLDSLLAYLSGRHESEAARLTDVAAICLTLVDAAEDAGDLATYAGPDHLLATVRPTAIKRALDNLIQNAIIYAGRADVRLEAGPGELTIAVEDDGPGIPEEQLSRVTEAFHRLDAARARNTTGLGLGLSIVRDVAEREGGRLTLSNRPQGGLRAALTLPLNR
ncbi:ATP-binding protein [Phenylobacterium deserti]|uniref:histidine kinase n=1 Tax=Phenylobacterium deserti TaxID=1914756 RepID=A0A328AT94_9CAUL|nr:ATP-binding protein [Phenylobacterium deserti]RAK57481.1 two-component sensor histidine kinase [Phenylobacterium deserti]